VGEKEEIYINLLPCIFIFSYLYLYIYSIPRETFHHSNIYQKVERGGFLLPGAIHRGGKRFPKLVFKNHYIKIVTNFHSTKRMDRKCRICLPNLEGGWGWLIFVNHCYTTFTTSINRYTPIPTPSHFQLQSAETPAEPNTAN
jgi:hypothetical protein